MKKIRNLVQLKMFERKICILCLKNLNEIGLELVMNCGNGIYIEGKDSSPLKAHENDPNSPQQGNESSNYILFDDFNSI